MESVRNDFFSYHWGRKIDEGSDKGRYFDGVDDVVSKEGDRRYTVREIVELCEIRRQTFYYHFADIYALMDRTLVLYGKPCRIRMWKNGCRNPTNKRKRIFI